MPPRSDRPRRTTLSRGAATATTTRPGLAAPYYVSRYMTGYDELDAAGIWKINAQYGPVWFPTQSDRLGALSLRTLELDCAVGLDLARRSALGFCPVALWPVGAHRRPLGLGSRELCCAAALCAGGRGVPRHAGCRAELGGRSHGRVVPARPRRGLLAELYARSRLRSQPEFRECSRCRGDRGASGRRAAFGGVPRGFRQPAVRDRGPARGLYQWARRSRLRAYLCLRSGCRTRRC